MPDDGQGVAGGRPPAARISGPDWRDRKDKPIYQVTLWPHQSLTRPGLYWMLGITAFMLSLPLMGLSGTPVFWVLLPFLIAAFLGLCWAIRCNGRNLSLSEDLWVWRDEMRVERREPDGRLLRWQAEPRKVRVRVHSDARVEDYLTLSGGGREIELGSFLAPEERMALSEELEAALTRARRA